MPLEKDIQIDGQHPDSFYEDEIRDLRRDSDIHRLSRRVTILSILIPCLQPAQPFPNVQIGKYKDRA